MRHSTHWPFYAPICKFCWLTVVLLACQSLTVSAATPTVTQIVEDYQVRAERVLEKLDATLERESTAIAARLTTAGDVDAAAFIARQVEMKKNAEDFKEPVHGSLTVLFDHYDKARTSALAPLKQDAVSRLDRLLETAAGKDMSVVLSVSDAKIIIASDEPVKDASGMSPRAFISRFRVPRNWGYYTSPAYPLRYGILTLNLDGTFALKSADPVEGTWKPTADPTVLEFVIAPAGGQGEERTTMRLTGKGQAEMKRYSGPRFLKAL